MTNLLNIKWSKIECIGLGLSLSAAILVASVGIRLSSIFEQPIFEKIIFFVFIFNAVFGFIVLFKNRWTWAVYSLVLGFGILLHAFVCFYQPSFAHNISFQDYILADLDSAPWYITSPWSFNLAQTYWKSFFRFLFPALAVVVISKQHKVIIFKWITLSFLVSFLANSLLAIYQGLVDITFWAQDSGTAVEAGRAAAFLEDSGSSSVYFAAMAVALFWSLVLARSVYCALWSAVLLIIGFAGGVFAGGRVFFASCLVAMSIGLFVSLFQSIVNRNRRKLFLLLTIVGMGTTIFWHLFFVHPFPSTELLLSSVNSIITEKLSFLDALKLLDESRFGHMVVMWKAFNDHFWTGTGLGSTLANVYTYGPKLNLGILLNDLPSCFYLQLMSELGLVGLGLVVALTIIWFWQIFILSSNKFVDIEATIFEGKNHVSWIIPAASGALTSLLVSLFIGIHIIYPIISAIAALALAIALSTMPVMQNRLSQPAIFARAWRYIIPSLAGYILFITSVQALNPPRVPAFRWLERGIPQIPYHLPGEMEGRSGYWVVGGTEILLKNKFTYLYILHPDKSLPVTVNVEFINTSAQKVRSQKFQLKERRGIRIELPEQMSEECLVSPKPTRFCSLRLKTVPDWQLENFEMGVFVADPEAKLSPTSK